ncbi:rod shape-determining protein MreC [Streptococcus didelphis]|uniref:Cell shape-determining protein MreC n=1 Tax=Streptococcus didelphis TaxID=102886 RepID=A0ABY9LFB6_9STRE|nr:rod shape-determining protein MreC [Streptococcus didelphis]WMB27621.1 rod shape-determining protein MreC [Streptococcus didelphis]WMB29511.1 rod shape-determining protein MreC [Streptococcus didelphis]
MFNKKLAKIFFWLTSSLIAIIIFSIIFSSSISPFFATVSNASLSKIDNYISIPFDMAKNGVSTTKDLVHTYQKNNQLEKELKDSKKDKASLKHYQKENKELKALLKINFSAPKQIVTKILTRTPSSWTDAIVIATPSKEKIRKNMLVASQDSLIGRVTNFSKTSAHVDLLTSGKVFDIPIKIVDKSTTIYGNLKSYNSEKQVMYSSEYNSNDAISVGSEAYTSGLDGETAADIPLGKVVKIENSDDKLKRKIFIKLSADFSHINYVYVLGRE